MKYTEDDLKEYAQWILDNYDFDMNGYLDSTEMIQVNIDFPNVFFYDSNYDYQYSYYEIVSALRNSYNPYTSMIVASNSTNASSNYSSYQAVAVPTGPAPAPQPTVPIAKEKSEEDRKLKEYTNWILKNYDINNDGELDDNEVQRLWSDIANYDYSGEIIAQVGQVQAWIAKYDTNRNGKLTLGELMEALNHIA